MKRAVIERALADLRSKRDRCTLHNMTFMPIPAEYKPHVEQELRRQFELWWDTWIAPNIDLIEREISMPAKKKD